MIKEELNDMDKETKEMLDNLMSMTITAVDDYPEGGYPDYIVARNPYEDDDFYEKRLAILGFNRVE